jgi:probable addiction module antidote protein
MMLPKPVSALESIDWRMEISVTEWPIMKYRTSVSHDEVMVKKLRRRPQFAAEYLKAAMEEADDPEVLLMALRQVAKAKGGLARVAKIAGLERESLYQALSEKGNPRLSTLLGIMRAVGLRLTVEMAHPVR